MHRILKDIINSTAEEVKKRKRQSSMDDPISYGHLPFKQCILNPKIGDIGLIAEIKLFSPVEGKLGEKIDILEMVKKYQQAGADAVSIITEKRTFNGSPDLVTTVKSSVLSLPILQKDFVIDGFQIKESYRLGADALLLIARMIDKDKLREFVSLCQGLGVEPVVEVCDVDDLNKAVGSGTEIIAVNARDLDTFQVEVDRACRLLKEIPQNFIKLGFSGIRSRAEVEKYKLAGAKAVLVGTELMRADDTNELIKELKNASFS